jgi:hypothetical protein
MQSPFGLRRTGFMSVLGETLAATACIACAMPISPPSGVTKEFRLIFWDLKGATVIPRRTRQRQIAATVTLFPTWDAEPITNRDMPVLICGISDHKKQGSENPCPNNLFYCGIRSGFLKITLNLAKYVFIPSGNAK